MHIGNEDDKEFSLTTTGQAEMYAKIIKEGYCEESVLLSLERCGDNVWNTDHWYVMPQDIDEIIEFLTIVKQHLTKKLG
jgi:uncharacterized protein with PIN domain